MAFPQQEEKPVKESPPQEQSDATAKSDDKKTDPPPVAKNKKLKKKKSSLTPEAPGQKAAASETPLRKDANIEPDKEAEDVSAPPESKPSPGVEFDQDRDTEYTGPSPKGRQSGQGRPSRRSVQDSGSSFPNVNRAKSTGPKARRYNDSSFEIYENA